MNPILQNNLEFNLLFRDDIGELPGFEPLAIILIDGENGFMPKQ